MRDIVKSDNSILKYMRNMGLNEKSEKLLLQISVIIFRKISVNYFINYKFVQPNLLTKYLLYLLHSLEVAVH